MTTITLYKLADQSNQTENQTQWGEGVTHTTTGIPAKLCSAGWLHAYEHPLLAVLLNPIHANFLAPRLWLAEGKGEVLREGQLKCGVKELTTIREIPLPVVTIEQRVRFAILCAKAVYRNKRWNAWADAWLSGEDRTGASAWSADRAASWAAPWAAESAAAWAARAARSEASSRAARAASLAAEASAEALAARTERPELDLIKLAEEACNV